MMEVLIPALEPKCPAVTALAFEGVPTKIRVMDGDADYGLFLAENWEDEVIVLEHDIVPWPGAIDELRKCPADWCVHEYTFDRSDVPEAPRPRVHWALGCLRVNKRLVAAHPDLPERWRGVLWHGVASEVIAALQAISTFSPHIHYPPFAHLKGM